MCIFNFCLDHQHSHYLKSIPSVVRCTASSSTPPVWPPPPAAANGVAEPSRQAHQAPQAGLGEDSEDRLQRPLQSRWWQAWCPDCKGKFFYIIYMWHSTVEPCYNKDLGTMRSTLLYQGKKETNKWKELLLLGVLPLSLAGPPTGLTASILLCLLPSFSVLHMIFLPPDCPVV